LKSLKPSLAAVIAKRDVSLLPARLGLDSSVEDEDFATAAGVALTGLDEDIVLAHSLLCELVALDRAYMWCKKSPETHLLDCLSSSAGWTWSARTAAIVLSLVPAEQKIEILNQIFVHYRPDEESLREFVALATKNSSFVPTVTTVDIFGLLIRSVPCHGALHTLEMLIRVNEDAMAALWRKTLARTMSSCIPCFKKGLTPTLSSTGTSMSSLKKRRRLEDEKDQRTREYKHWLRRPNGHVGCLDPATRKYHEHWRVTYACDPDDWVVPALPFPQDEGSLLWADGAAADASAYLWPCRFLIQGSVLPQLVGATKDVIREQSVKMSWWMHMILLCLRSCDGDHGHELVSRHVLALPEVYSPAVVSALALTCISENLLVAAQSFLDMPGVFERVGVLAAVLAGCRALGWKQGGSGGVLDSKRAALAVATLARAEAEGLPMDVLDLMMQGMMDRGLDLDDGMLFHMLDGRTTWSASQMRAVLHAAAASGRQALAGAVYAKCRDRKDDGTSTKPASDEHDKDDGAALSRRFSFAEFMLVTRVNGVLLSFANTNFRGFRLCPEIMIHLTGVLRKDVARLFAATPRCRLACLLRDVQEVSSALADPFLVHASATLVAVLQTYVRESGGPASESMVYSLF
jgi:hypothetical protein